MFFQWGSGALGGERRFESFFVLVVALRFTREGGEKMFFICTRFLIYSNIFSKYETIVRYYVRTFSSKILFNLL